MDFSLLETMRLNEGTIVRLERHLARLAGSARQFGYAYDESRIRDAVVETVRAHPRASGASGCSSRVMVRRRSSACPTRSDPRAWRVTFASDPVDSRDPFLANKTTHREVYDSARRARPDVDDVILSNERGEITEATIANIVVEIDGVRLTPPLASGLLGGAFRGELLDSNQIHERVLTRDDVTRASRVWLINSLREWIDVVLA